MHTNIVNNSKRTRVINATAAGTTAINGAAVDMQDYESVVFDVLFGALTAGQVTSIKAQGSLDGSTNWTDLAGTSTGPMADGDSNKLLVLEVFRSPSFRFLRVVVVRGTQNAVVDGAVATQYHVRKAPTTDDTTVSARKTVVEPAAGTP